MNLKGHANQNTQKSSAHHGRPGQCPSFLLSEHVKQEFLKWNWVCLPTISWIFKKCVHMNSAQWAHTGWPGSGCVPVHVCAGLHLTAPASGQVQAKQCTPPVQGAPSRWLHPPGTQFGGHRSDDLPRVAETRSRLRLTWWVNSAVALKSTYAQAWCSPVAPANLKIMRETVWHPGKGTGLHQKTQIFLSILLATLRGRGKSLLLWD